jgi:hypothetical protein
MQLCIVYRFNNIPLYSIIISLIIFKHWETLCNIYMHFFYIYIYIYIYIYKLEIILNYSLIYNGYLLLFLYHSSLAVI